MVKSMIAVFFVSFVTLINCDQADAANLQMLSNQYCDALLEGPIIEGDLKLIEAFIDNSDLRDHGANATTVFCRW
jgi:hypothetical protein